MPITSLNESPWRFRVISDGDSDGLRRQIEENGFESVSPPTVAVIGKKYYVVDGHSRIDAAKAAKISSVPCQIASNVNTFQQMRILSYNLNRDGYSNPLPLSDMFYEDLKLLGDREKLADAYGVSVEYVHSLLKIRELHDDSKVVIQKVIQTARRKYRTLLQQLTPAHLSSLSSLTKEKQLQVIDWLFRDIMYGPPDESMVSIPSIYEIVDEIDKVTNLREKKTYEKKTHEQRQKQRQLEFTCVCGAKYDIDTKEKTVYEYLEQNNVIVKKEFKADHPIRVFTSDDCSKSELKELIDKSSGKNIRLIFIEGANHN